MNENENTKTYIFTHACEECGEIYTEDGPMTCYYCPGADLIRVDEPKTITL